MIVSHFAYLYNRDKEGRNAKALDLLQKYPGNGKILLLSLYSWLQTITEMDMQTEFLLNKSNAIYGLLCEKLHRQAQIADNWQRN